MKIWINKNKIQERHDIEFNEAYEFSIKRNEYSTMYTHIDYVWRQFGVQALNTVYEDLFIIGMSVFSIDKRISRTLFLDNWTRELEVSIPVIEIDKWNGVKEKLNEILGYLTGDIWKIEFRETEERYMQCNSNINRKNRFNKEEYNAVSLFSGGLDSFCGALELMSQGKSLCLIGHKKLYQMQLISNIHCKNVNL